MPNPSPRDGTTTNAFRSYTSATFSTRPRNVTPSGAAALSSASSGPAPAISSVSAGTRSRAAANARSSTSSPLIGISLPTAATFVGDGGAGGSGPAAIP